MRSIIILLYLGFALLAGFGFSQESEIPKGPWTDLFNGKDLEGWEFSGDPPWHVEDGLIQTKGGDSKTYLIWPKPLKNLELKLRYKLSSGRANSGIQVRSVCADRKQSLPNCGGKYVLCGPQLDVAEAYSGRLFNECSGFLQKNSPQIKECRRTLEVGKWMETTARVKDDKISLWFNGTHCLDFTLKDAEHLDGEIFGIQSHPPYDLIEWEYVKIRDLDAPDPVRGCMNPKSSNYNQQAVVDDGSCLACTDVSASNYDPFCKTHDCVDNGKCAVGIVAVQKNTDSQLHYSGNAIVTYSINDGGPYRLTLLDPAGNIILEHSAEGPVQKANFSLPFRGIFIFRIQTPAGSYLKKMINL